jgi:hypothetical protein
VSRFVARPPAIACLIGLSAAGLAAAGLSAAGPAAMGPAAMGPAAMGFVAVALSGCVGPDGGYGYGGDLGVDYYEPYGFAYGGWPRDYHVGPYYPNGHGFAGAGFHGQHAFRPAPAGHAMPSLPAERGGGGGHEGGAGGRR